MARERPFVREAGAGGPAVVCIHSNASTSAQWRDLTERLAPRRRVLAPDSYGAGRSIEWPSDRVITLSDEVEFIAPVLEDAGERHAIVGHSYGAAVALLAALRQPQRVGALVLYEPTLFALVDAHVPPPNGADGIRHAVAAAGAALDDGQHDEAARHFIDFWMGAGSWARTPAERKPVIARSVANVRRWAHALFTEPTPLQAFGTLSMPVLYLVGERSPESARAVARRLAPVLPQARQVELPGLGHMGPITDPGVVNEVIAAFLDDTMPVAAA